MPFTRVHGAHRIRVWRHACRKADRSDSIPRAPPIVQRSRTQFSASFMRLREVIMDDHTRVRTMVKWTAGALGIAAGAYGGYVGLTWLRY